MNMKQKMIAAMQAAKLEWDMRKGPAGPNEPYDVVLNAALDVLADPENWDEGMAKAWWDAPIGGRSEFTAVINHIKEMSDDQSSNR